MIDLHCSEEVESIISYLDIVQIPHKVTSTWRPGAVTVSGNLSNHAKKLAVDFAGPTPTWNSETLAEIFRAFVPVEAHLSELIYSGPQVTYNIKHGKRVAKYAQALHHNHVHVAVEPGVLLTELLPRHADESPDVINGNERTDLPVAITVPHPHGRGYLVLQTRDGGVFTYDDCPFFGSLVGVDTGPNGSGPAAALAWTPTGEGYWILDAEGAVFSYGDAQYFGGVNAGPLKDHFGNRIPVGIYPTGNGYKIVGQDISGDSSPFDSYQLPV